MARTIALCVLWATTLVVLAPRTSAAPLPLDEGLVAVHATGPVPVPFPAMPAGVDDLHPWQPFRFTDLSTATAYYTLKMFVPIWPPIDLDPSHIDGAEIARTAPAGDADPPQAAPAVTVPEGGSLALLVTGLAGLAVRRRRAGGTRRT
jgi:hypothetical protein